MKRRSSGAVTLGAVALLASWAFGSTPTMVVGVGLILAGLVARLWARRARESVEVDRRILPGERIEGGDLRIVVRIRRRQPLFGASVVLQQQLGTEERTVRMRGPRAEIVFSDLPRGRHRLGPLTVTIADPLGLEQVEQRVDDGVSVLVRPRIPALGSVFSSHGAREAGALRTTFRRPSGFEIHAIREYVPGEPLRAVHWPSTARRGQLMVKELDDAPRDELVVVLDLDPAGNVGPVGRSSFDAAVRAAGALALAQALWNRRVIIIGTSTSFGTVQVSSAGHDWDVALDALAAVTPITGSTLGPALRSAVGPIAHAREVIVVSAMADLAVEPILELRGRGRTVSLVVIAAETFAGRARARSQPAFTRLAAQGVSVAFVSADRPLAEALSGSLARSLSA